MPPKQVKKTKPVLVNADGSPASIIKYDRAQKYWRCQLCCGKPTITDEWSSHLSSKMHLQRVKYVEEGTLVDDENGHQYERAFLAPGLRRLPGVPHQQSPPGLILDQDIFETPDEDQPREALLQMLADANNGADANMADIGPQPVYQPPPQVGTPLTEETGIEILEALRTNTRTMETLQESLLNWEEAADRSQGMQQQWLMPGRPRSSGDGA